MIMDFVKELFGSEIGLNAVTLVTWMTFCVVIESIGSVCKTALRSGRKVSG